MPFCVHMDNHVQKSSLKREHPKETKPSKVTELAFLSFSCSVMSNSLRPHGLQHTRLRHLPELAQTYLHWVSDAIQPSCPLSSPSPPAFNLLEESRIALDFISPWRVSQVSSMWLLDSSLQHRTCQMSFRSFQNLVTHFWVSTWGLGEFQDAVSLLICVAPLCKL